MLSNSLSLNHFNLSRIGSLGRQAVQTTFGESDRLREKEIGFIDWILDCSELVSIVSLKLGLIGVFRLFRSTEGNPVRLIGSV